MIEAKIKAIAPWFGGKRTLAPEVVKQLGKHTQYFEPFCGSMAVLFAKPQCSQETVNDLHGDVTNLAWVLQDETLASELYARAARTLFAETLIKRFWKDLAHEPIPKTVNSDRAYKFFVFSWAMRNGVSGTTRARGNGFSIAAPKGEVMPDVTLTIESHDAKYCQFCGSRLIHDTNAGDPVAECWIECEKLCRAFTWNEERKERYWKRHIEAVAVLTKRCEDLERQLEAAREVAA